jgi:Flp pilus assembly protein protease CpaA
MAPIAHLVAELTTQVVWPAFLNHPDTLVFMIPIAAILVGGVIGVAKLVIRHRERMAMIERGIHPDRPVDPEE